MSSSAVPVSHQTMVADIDAQHRTIMIILRDAARGGSDASRWQLAERAFHAHFSAEEAAMLAANYPKEKANLHAGRHTSLMSALKGLCSGGSVTPVEFEEEVRKHIAEFDFEFADFLRSTDALALAGHAMNKTFIRAIG